MLIDLAFRTRPPFRATIVRRDGWPAAGTGPVFKAGRRLPVDDVLAGRPWDDPNGINFSQFGLR
jgi:hypothetical protein